MMEKEKLPVIIYNSSRLNCDTYSKMVSSMCFLDEKEKELMNEAMTSILSINDEQFKTAVCEIEKCKQRMMNGVAVHHSSLMKLTKEFIEECFASEGIKVIFSTETLAVGLNMPATSVIFTSLFKFDGKKDPTRKGLVVFSLAETVNKNVLFELMNTASEDLKSQVNIRYSDILYYAEKNNLEALEKIMDLSFKKFQNSLNERIELISGKLSADEKPQQVINFSKSFGTPTVKTIFRNGKLLKNNIKEKNDNEIDNDSKCALHGYDKGSTISSLSRTSSRTSSSSKMSEKK
uniref:Helicase C-terminal domain-containing protein n=1 Tax=Strongyloides papillosus TaxID=174720 RepID=A0A0N5CAJ6_STREA